MKIKIFSEAEMRGSPCAGLRGCQRSSTAGLYEGRPLYVREKLRLESGGNRFPDAQFHFMHIVPETHFGFDMEGAICSRAFIIFSIFLELRGVIAVFNMS